MNPADYIVCAVYFAVMIWIGLKYAPYMKAFSTYFAGEKSLPWWLSGLSFFMSYKSSLTIVVYGGLGYQYGLVSLIIYRCTVPACLVATLLLARRWHRAAALTPVEFLEKRYHPFLRQLFAWTGVPFRLIDDGLKLLSLGTFLSAGMGLSLVPLLAIIGSVVVLYTLLGGVWAVTLTDTVQFVVILTALVLLLVLGIEHAGGPAALLDHLPRSYWQPISGPYDVRFIVSLLLILVLNFGSNWSLIQRFYSAKTDEDAVRAGLLASFSFLVLPPLWSFAGMAARVVLGNGVAPQSALALLSTRVLPPGVLGLMVACMTAAAMSALSADYNVVSGVITVDILERLRPATRRTIARARWITLATGVAPIAIAVIVAFRKLAIFDVMTTIFGLFSAPVAIPTIVGLVNRTVHWRAALSGYVSGAIAAVFLALFLPHGNGYGFQSTSALVTISASTLGIMLGQKFIRPAAGEQERIRGFFMAATRTEPQVQQSPELPSPFYLAGAAISAISLALLGCGLVQRHVLTAGTGLALLLISTLLLKRFRLVAAGRRSASAGIAPQAAERTPAERAGQEPLAGV